MVRLLNLPGKVETRGGRRRFRPKKPWVKKRFGKEQPMTTGSGPAPLAIAEYARRAAYVKPFMAHFEARFKGKTEAVKLVEELIEKLKNDAVPEMCIALTTPGNQRRKVLMFFTAERDKYILLEQDFVLETIRRSKAYMTRKRCLAAYEHNSVEWRESISFRQVLHDS